MADEAGNRSAKLHRGRNGPSGTVVAQRPLGNRSSRGAGRDTGPGGDDGAPVEEHGPFAPAPTAARTGPCARLSNAHGWKDLVRRPIAHLAPPWGP
jgi:hypothetical protein